MSEETEENGKILYMYIIYRRAHIGKISSIIFITKKTRNELINVNIHDMVYM
jgi:hypothetical protein